MVRAKKYKMGKYSVSQVNQHRAQVNREERRVTYRVEQVKISGAQVSYILEQVY